MPTRHIKVKTIKLAHTVNDAVKIEHIEKPYGEYSSPVVSIAYYAHGTDKESHVEIPYENIGEFFEALRESIKLCDSIPRNEPHAEINEITDGGGS